MFDSGSQKQKPEQINMLNDHPPPDLLFIFQGFCFTAPELVSCCELDTGDDTLLARISKSNFFTELCGGYSNLYKVK